MYYLITVYLTKNNKLVKDLLLIFTVRYENNWNELSYVLSIFLIGL